MLNEYITNNYLRAIIIFIVLFIVLRIFISIVERIILKLVKKTKTDLDDIIIKKTSLPITLILIVITIEIGINELVLTETLQEITNKLINSAIILLVGYSAYVVLDLFLIETWKKVIVKTNKKSIESLTHLLRGIFKVVIISVLILYLLHYWGIEITPLLAGLGIAGLAVALAIQPTLANLFSGIAIILDNSVHVGDLVYLDANTKGKILKIGLRSTKINTFDNEIIIIPNTKLADSTLQNVALPEPKSRVVISFGVAYGSEVNKVKSIVLNEIKSIKLACKYPEPLVRFIEMGESSLNFKVYFYVDSYEDRFSSIDEANTKIYSALRKNKIEIPFPQIDIHMKKD